jgi:hypothetical protein
METGTDPQQGNAEMTTVAQKGDFKVWFNGKSTWMVCDNNGDCLMVKSSEKQAINWMNKYC